MDRRAFVKLLTASGAGLASYSGWCGAGNHLMETGMLEKHLVYDSRVIDSRGIADVLFASVERAYSFTSDVTPIWYEDLHSLWQRHEIMTIGITREAEFFVLSTMARDYGYGVWGRDDRPGYTVWMLAPVTGLGGRFHPIESRTRP